MSLLRRRMMMQQQEKKEEHAIYVYRGFVPMSGNVSDEPYAHDSYPTAFTTSVIEIEARDRVIVDFINTGTGNANSQRIRIYKYADGSYHTSAMKWNEQKFDDKYYIRFLGTGDGEKIEKVTVIKEDGELIEYKIIDLR